VKTYADDSLFWPLDINRKVEANIFLREGNLSLNESWRKLGTTERIYHKVEETREIISPWAFPQEGTKKPDLDLHRVFVRLDGSKEIIQIKLYGLLDFVSQLGGIGSFLFTVG
jgi:hypothetical protein